MDVARGLIATVASKPAKRRERVCVFIAPQCFAAPQIFQRIVGLRLGLLGLYWGAVLIAIGEPHGAYDRSGRMLVGCFIRWRTAQDMRISDAQHVELCGMPITAWMPMR